MKPEKLNAIHDIIEKCRELDELKKLKQTIQVQISQRQGILHLIETRIEQVGGENRNG